MMVNFLILGAQKGGSTWLYNALRLHPQVYTPKHEIHFFSNDENFRKGVTWYHSQFETKNTPVLYGEKTPEYLTVIPTVNKKTSQETAKRILQYNRDMKLLVVLREPIGRLRSAINHMYRTRRIAPWVSAADLILGKNREAGEAFSLLQNGQYYENLKEYFDLFGPSQIKIIFFETDILQRPAETLQDVCKFLEIPYDASYFPSPSEKKNEYQMSLPAITLNYLFPILRQVNNRLNHIFPTYKVKIDPKTRIFLQDFYRTSNEKLRTLTGTLPDSWRYR